MTSVQENQTTQTVFVVVDKKDEKLEEKLRSIAGENLGDKTVEVLQKQEYELIKRLIQQGMIEVKGELKQLYAPVQVQASNQIQIKKASLIV